LTAVVPALAQPQDKVLRYVSQRADKAYLREGPTYAHRVLWVYRHRGYPFAVLAEFDVWRRVRAADGAVGWMSASMLTDQRTVLVTGKGRAKIFADAGGGKVVALADPGAVAGLLACAPTACHVRGEDIDGWIPKDSIWGVGADEVFSK
jgi:SH3-like domain-containing protein